jgi:serine/threonine-protein phosphatase PP1 catalytic subunit
MMAGGDLLQKAGDLFEKEPRLIRLPSRGKVIFVGDTHGDLDATEEITRQYLKEPCRVVFLGDYVDRGRYSAENILHLLRLKVEHPDDIYLLAGNHEGYSTKQFFPADFWDSLSTEERESFGRLFEKLPLAAAAENGVLALHGGLPDLPGLEDVNGIAWGDDSWSRIVWGDFVEQPGEVLGEWGGRLQLGEQYFSRLMQRYRKRLLIRSHQPDSPRQMFDRRCITIFTSRAYVPTRTVVLVDLEKEIRTAADVTIYTI